MEFKGASLLIFQDIIFKDMIFTRTVNNNNNNNNLASFHPLAFYLG